MVGHPPLYCPAPAPIRSTAAARHTVASPPDPHGRGGRTAPFLARIIIAGAHQRGGCGNGVTEVNDFVRAGDDDPRSNRGRPPDG